MTLGAERIDLALVNLEPDSCRGRSDNPHYPLLAGQPSLDSDGDVGLMLFSRGGRSTRSDSTARWTSCSAVWCAPVAGCGWPTASTT